MSDPFKDIDNIVHWTKAIAERHSLSFDQALSIMNMLRFEQIHEALESITASVSAIDDIRHIMEQRNAS